MLRLSTTSILILITIILLNLPLSQSSLQDQVHFPIPDYNNHKWYSGYLHFDMGKFHYIFFQSQRDPANDPLLLWLNGGPGCSSLIGMMNQNGPFIFAEGKVNFKVNQYSWNMKANVLYIQSPGGVGFSYGLRNNNNTDQTVAEDNLKALEAFYSKFPTFKKNDFYIAGQSYAGVYVPYLSHQIIKYNKLPSRKLTINFKGMMIGNACTDPRECYQPGADSNVSIYQYQYLYNHGFYTEKQFDDMKASCWLGYKSEQCGNLREKLDKKFAETNTSLLNIYLPCYYNKVQKINANGQKKYKQLQSGKKLDLADFVDCDDHQGIDNFFNQATIQGALHVDPTHWQMCSDTVADHYHVGQNQSYWLYPLLIKEKIRIWVYSGDHDADVPITGTMIWLKRLREDYGLPVEDPWREWWVRGLHKHQDQVAGMTWGLRGLTFASVKAAGHMVPRDQQKAAYVLVNAFLEGKRLPDKDQ